MADLYAPPQPLPPPPATGVAEQPAATGSEHHVYKPTTAATKAPPATVPNKTQRARLYITCLLLAAVCLIAQAVFMETKLKRKANQSSYINSLMRSPPTATGKRLLLTLTHASAPTQALTLQATDSIVAHRSLQQVPAASIGTISFLAGSSSSISDTTTTTPISISRKLLRKRHRYRGSFGDFYNFDHGMKGKVVAKAPGLVIATSVLSLVAAGCLLALVTIAPPGPADMPWAVLGEAVAVAVLVPLWVASVVVSGMGAQVLHEGKGVVPKSWFAGNAIALVFAMASACVWFAVGVYAAAAVRARLRQQGGFWLE